MLRTFIGVRIRLCPSIRRVLDELDCLPRPVTAVLRENLHITVKFLGPTAEARLPEICRRLKDICSRTAPIDASMENVDCFPRRERPAVVWIGLRETDSVNDAPRFKQLAAQIDEAMAELGFQPESRAFHPHLTLARIKGRASERVHQIIAQHEHDRFGECSITELQLIQSELGRSGPRYLDMATFELGVADPEDDRDRVSEPHR